MTCPIDYFGALFTDLLLLTASEPLKAAAEEISSTPVTTASPINSSSHRRILVVAGSRTGEGRGGEKRGHHGKMVHRRLLLKYACTQSYRAAGVLFQSAMMNDPSNVHEFALSTHRALSEAELSRFLYSDALGGGLNYLWIGPLLGLTAGGIGAVIGRLAR